MKTSILFAVFALFALFALLVPGCLHGADAAAQPDVSAPRGAWTVTFENDVLTGSGNNYTNGLGLAGVSAARTRYDADSVVHRWGDFWSFLPFVGQEGTRTYVAWPVSQEMHTRDDTKNPDPLPDDQPHAGLLVLDSLVYARGEQATHVWQLRPGVVGPASQAERVHKGLHHLIGGDRPMGWSKQLPHRPPSSNPLQRCA